MPLRGEYEPSLIGWDDATRRDLPVVILTTLGGKSGKIRKSPLMRVEHDGSYAVVASAGEAPKHPFWYHKPSRRFLPMPSSRRRWTVRSRSSSWSRRLWRTDAAWSVHTRISPAVFP